MIPGTKIICVDRTGRTHVNRVVGTSITVPANQFVYAVFIDGYPVVVRTVYNDNTTPTGFTFLECYAMQFGLGDVPIGDQLPVSAAEREITLSGLPYRRINANAEFTHL